MGRCKTFDASADGYGRGEGCAALVLRPESSGEAPGSSQPPQAVLRGSLVNQDGRSSSLTAPNGPSQTALISSVIQNAGEKQSMRSVLGHSLEYRMRTRILQAAAVWVICASIPIERAAVQGWTLGSWATWLCMALAHL